MKWLIKCSDLEKTVTLQIEIEVTEEDDFEEYSDENLPKHYWGGDDGCELLFEN